MTVFSSDDKPDPFVHACLSKIDQLFPLLFPEEEKDTAHFSVRNPIPSKGMDSRTVGSLIPVSHESLTDQSQPGEATPTGLRYQEVSKFVPADASPVCCSTTSELNRSTGLSQCSEDVPPDNLDEVSITTKAQAEARGLAVPIKNGSPQGVEDDDTVKR